MIILYGRSPSGKTTYFRELFKGRETRIIHASDINELRKGIISVQSPLNENEPTLINTWFDLDCKEIVRYIHYDVYIETHYFETYQNGIKVVTNGKSKHYFGLYNDHLIPQSNKKLFIKKSESGKKDNSMEWIIYLGTRYRYMQSMFPEIIK